MSQSWTHPLGHADVLDGLWRAAAAERLPHALLFDGPDGIGKFLAARHFTAGMFCEHGPADPCGKCGACLRLASGGEESNHPDLLVIDPIAAGEEVIRIGHIAHRENDSSAESVPLRRTVEGFFDLKAQAGGARVVIIREADRLNLAAQNALLKTLEEPRPGNMMILVVSHSDGLLDTVISRITRVGFDKLEPALAERLIEQHGIEGRAARQLARWAGGSPGRALELHDQGRGRQTELMAGLIDGSGGALGAGHAMWQLEGEFPGKTERGKERRRVRSILDLALELVSDLGSLQAGVAPSDLAHGELLNPVHQRGVGSVLQPLRKRLIQARADVDSNLTPSAVLDYALLGMARLAPRKS